MAKKKTEHVTDELIRMSGEEYKKMQEELAKRAKKQNGKGKNGK